MTPFEAGELVGVPRTDVRELAIEGSTEIAFEFTVAESDWFAAWTQLRAVVKLTERWPLALFTYSTIESATSRLDWMGPHGLDVAPNEMIRRVPDLDIDAVLESFRTSRDEFLPDDEDLERYLRSIETYPHLQLVDLQSAVGADPTMVQVDRWVLDQQQLAGCTLDADPDAWYLKLPSWSDARHHMLLLPTSQSWQAAAYVGGYGWGHPHPDLRAAILRRWQLRYGAEVALNTTTSLFFVVDRPPQTIDEAWVIAEEVNLLWPDTAGGRNGVDTRTHAQDLVGRDTWYVISDP